MRRLILFFILIVTACGAQSTPTALPASAPTATQAPTVAVAAPSAQPTSVGTTAPSAPTSIATQAPAVLSESLNASGERVLGRPDAPIALADYSDFL